MRESKFKILLIIFMILANTLFLYSTEVSESHYLIVYLSFYFIPVVLAGFWFGLRSALTTSISVTTIYLPFTVMHWKGFSESDLNNIIEMILFNVVAVMLGVLRDRERAEQKRSREVEGMAAIGRAMSGVAHDMKTPLIAIGGFSRLVQGKLQKCDSGSEHCMIVTKEAREKLDIVISETRRLESMVKDMLDFAGPLELHQSKVDIIQLVGECFDVIQDIAQDKGIKLKTQSCDALPPVHLDAMRMKRALINLVMNAVHASPEGENVTINCSRNGNSATIDVIDRGCGIPREKRKEIFSPFFSTKKEGTGLGLPIAKKIVEAHQGHIEVLNNPERGLTFRVHLPIAPD
jgi:two-component system, NtrC family, sensor histidine kinase HydH